MRTIETNAIVTSEGLLTVQVPVPPDLPPGEHPVVLVIGEEAVHPQQRLLLELPVIHVGLWPANLSLRREDLYGDDGR